jgi:hypothetical protein
MVVIFRPAVPALPRDMTRKGAKVLGAPEPEVAWEVPGRAWAAAAAKLQMLKLVVVVLTRGFKTVKDEKEV